MKPRERFIAALERRPIAGRVPHFELVFFLTMEAFGKVHPSHRRYDQWFQMTETERELHRQDMADIFIATARRYEHSAIFIHNPVGDVEEYQRLIDKIRAKTGDTYFLMMHGDATYGLPSGETMMEWVGRMYDRPQELEDEAQRNVDRALARAEKLQGKGLDGFALCSDYCFNTGPFLRPEQFACFVTPYLRQLIAGYREMDFYTIKHTDGNIIPIIDQLVDCNPHALHSLDPQAGVDIKVVKEMYGRRVCLCGNVNCGLIDTGTDEEYLESARYALAHGMPGYGYIFCTSNCIYTGMRLERYEKILDLWREMGNYGQIGKWANRK
jgi:uroporphyrinogen decarboxylase